MNVRYLLIMMLSVCSANILVARRVAPQNDQFQSCPCYCSDKCGLRDSREDDTPFYDEEFKECFCKQRDKNNYMPNKCNMKPKTKRHAPTCCKMNKKAQ